MRKFIAVAAFCICTLALWGCGLPQGNSGNGETQEEAALEDAETEEAATSTSYLTGLPVPPSIQSARPLAVMLNNIKEGCPQSGTADASIIYEAPVEGRITRLMGLFEDYGDMEKIGSIRSSRDYFVYFALEYDAIYAHFGQATPYVGELLNSDRVANISGAVAGIDEPATHAFFRSTDRKAPHNVYLTGEGVEKDIEKFQYRTYLRSGYQPKFIFAENNMEDGQEAAVLYPGGKDSNLANGFSHTQSKFEYHPDDRLYYRFQYGAEHIDELTGEQLAFTNVVFQYCHGEVRDENDYLAFGCHGDDGHKVQVFTRGKMTEGTWRRTGNDDAAEYLDKDGNPIPMNPGKTWICIIWDEYGDDVVIE